ncbi:MAG: hypothetical protein O7H41_13900, partial [Planctomycetota bacterium]|nr:hypothetical protein [Planctomycetota bacterium]
KNEIKVTITETGEVEIDLTGAKGTVEELKKLLKDLTGRLGPVTAERHVPGHHHGHAGLREHITGA